MRDARGVVRVMDFGIAKALGMASGGATVTGQIIGTPEYMSPEQARGDQIDFRSDIYALGIVVFEIFTGSVPFRGETPIATLFKHIQDPPPIEGRRGIPPRLVPILKKALAKDPADRFESARAMAAALREGVRKGKGAWGREPTAVFTVPTVVAAHRGRRSAPRTRASPLRPRSPDPRIGHPPRPSRPAPPPPPRPAAESRRAPVDRGRGHRPAALVGAALLVLRPRAPPCRRAPSPRPRFRSPGPRRFPPRRPSWRRRRRAALPTPSPRPRAVTRASRHHRARPWSPARREPSPTPVVPAIG